MTTFIALLRGINVGGNNKVPMADSRELVRGIGFENVQTYVQSGNLVFSAAEENPETVRHHLESTVAERFGSAVKVMVLTRAEINNAVRSNLYAKITTQPTKLHLGFMDTEPDLAALEALRSKPHGTDQWTSMGRFLYLHAPDGMGRSALAAFVERTVKVVVMFRDWRTVLMLGELAEASRVK